MPRELMSADFRAPDLATLQEHVDTFVDEMLESGVQAWDCNVWPSWIKSMREGAPDVLQWHCTVSESGSFERRVL